MARINHNINWSRDLQRFSDFKIGIPTQTKLTKNAMTKKNIYGNVNHTKGFTLGSFLKAASNSLDDLCL